MTTQIVFASRDIRSPNIEIVGSPIEKLQLVRKWSQIQF